MRDDAMTITDVLFFGRDCFRLVKLFVPTNTIISINLFLKRLNCLIWKD
jgi:hypothetical protein